MGLIAHAFPDFFGGCPEANDQGVNFKAGEICGVGREAPASRNHSLLAGNQFADDFLLEFAKRRLALLRKNIADGFSRARFDDVISVQKREVQVRGDEVADRRFARTHKADERNIVNLARRAHGIELADLIAVGTQFLCALLHEVLLEGVLPKNMD